MKTCIRFEDTYGMFSIFSVLQGKTKELMDNSNRRQFVNEFGDYVWVDRGLSSTGVFRLTINDVLNYIRCGVERVIFVYDLDNLGHRTDILLTEGQFKYGSDTSNANKKGAEFAVQLLASKGIKAEFLPIAYSSETIMLYQYATDNLDPFDIVHTQDVQYLNELLIRKFIEKRIDDRDTLKNEVKKSHKFLDSNELISYGNSLLNSMNNKVFEWLSTECSADYHFYPYTTAIHYLRYSSREFERAKINPKYSGLTLTTQNKDFYIDLSKSVEEIKQDLQFNKH